jgi:hypothetical protein
VHEIVAHEKHALPRLDAGDRAVITNAREYRSVAGLGKADNHVGARRDCTIGAPEWHSGLFLTRAALRAQYGPHNVTRSPMLVLQCQFEWLLNLNTPGQAMLRDLWHDRSGGS